MFTFGLCFAGICWTEKSECGFFSVGLSDDDMLLFAHYRWWLSCQATASAAIVLVETLYLFRQPVKSAPQVAVRSGRSCNACMCLMASKRNVLFYINVQNCSHYDVLEALQVQCDVWEVCLSAYKSTNYQNNSDILCFVTRRSDPTWARLQSWGFICCFPFHQLLKWQTMRRCSVGEHATVPTRVSVSTPSAHQRRNCFLLQFITGKLRDSKVWVSLCWPWSCRPGYLLTYLLTYAPSLRLFTWPELRLVLHLGLWEL